MNAANRVVVNTAILYGRMMLTIGITLYSTRLVLNALGNTDYGIFNLIGSVILMLAFLNAAMSTSTQRFLSYHQGKNDVQKQKEVFTNSVFLHILIGFLIVIGLEIAGLILFNGFLNIPPNRLEAAYSIYHYMSFSVFFTIIGVPFNGSLIAHENMLWIAVVNVIETVLKLSIALSLSYISSDRLVYFGFFNASVTAISFFLYLIYSLRKYPECTFKGIARPKRTLIIQLSSFAGWNLFGALCGMARNQGLALVLNLFFGTIVNAAYGLANQVGTQLLFFSNTMLRALNPQIMKSEGAGDRNRMVFLSMKASKFGFLLLSFFAIPVIFEIDSILKVWLKEVPSGTAVFCKLVLIGSLMNQLTIGLQSALQATGEIKYYQILVGSTLLLNIPLAFVLLKFGNDAYVVLVSYVCIEFTACILRIFIAKRLIRLRTLDYFNEVIMRVLKPALLTSFVCFFCVSNLNLEFRFVWTIVVSCVIFLVTSYTLALTFEEKKLVRKILKKIQLKLALHK